MPDTQIYNFFRDDGPGKEGRLLFKVKLEPQLRPKIGDSFTSPLTFENFRIMREESEASLVVVIDGGLQRVTDTGLIRVTDGEGLPATVTNKYFVLPANNPNRISTWTKSGFANDKTLNQLFR